MFAVAKRGAQLVAYNGGEVHFVPSKGVSRRRSVALDGASHAIATGDRNSDRVPNVAARIVNRLVLATRVIKDNRLVLLDREACQQVCLRFVAPMANASKPPIGANQPK